MTVVCNSTPLIALSRIGTFELLNTYFGDVYIPQAVFDKKTIDDLMAVGFRLGEKEYKKIVRRG